MRELTKLYKKTTKGQIQFWSIEVDGAKFRTVVGKEGGKAITSAWTVCKGKNTGKANATTDVEQCLKEAKAKIDRKKEKGYEEDINKAGRAKFFEPMLAEKYEKYKDKIKFPVFSQPKLDGVRCTIKKEGMFSRNGKPIISAPHIHESLKSFFKENPMVVLDGELYNHKLKNDFPKIISLVRKTKPTDEDLAESKKIIQYYVYDNFADNCRLRAFGARLNVLAPGLLFHLKDNDSVKILETTRAHSHDNLDLLYEDYLKDGYEGQIIRVDAPYENKRSKNLLKRKDFIDEDFTIIDIEEGEGNRAGGAGKIVFKTKDGKEFRAGIRGSFDFFKALLKNKKDLIGVEATVCFFEYTPDGIPRFPVVVAIRDYE